MYVNAKIIPVETIPGMGVRDKGEQCGGCKYGIFDIHCKNFCKCHKIHPPGTTIKKQVSLSSNPSPSKRKSNKRRMSLFIILLANFSAEILQARRELEYIFKVLKEQN
jgi:hypothetical protein